MSAMGCGQCGQAIEIDLVFDFHDCGILQTLCLQHSRTWGQHLGGHPQGAAGGGIPSGAHGAGASHGTGADGNTPSTAQRYLIAAYR